MSFKDQLQLLKSRGMQVDDYNAALDYLERIGYYRLSGYWYPMRRIDHAESMRKNTPVRADDFVPGSRFEDAVRLYVFDKKLRLLALDALERIEMAVRVDVAYVLGKRHPLAHERPEFLHGAFTKKTSTKEEHSGQTPHQIWLKTYDKQVLRSKELPFVKHHQEIYGGKLPIWVAIEIWDFGMLSKMFTGLKHEDQESIAHAYGAENAKAFSNWLHSLNIIRNISAHHSRLWNANIGPKSAIPRNWPGTLNNRRPFFYFCLMQHFLRHICPNSTWGDRFKDLLATGFPTAMHIALSDMGTCDNWEEWKLWQKPSP